VGLLRVVAYMLGAVLVVSVLRSIIGIVLKGFAELFRPPQASTPAHPSTEGMGGELKKDPVCGTFISPATAFQKSVDGKTLYFCSPECRDKFVLSR